MLWECFALGKQVDVIIGKREFLSNYYKKNPIYYVMLLFTVACDALGLALLVINMYKLISKGADFSNLKSSEIPSLIWAVVGLCLCVLGFVFLFMTRKCLMKANDAYSKYLASLRVKPDFKDEDIVPMDDEWKCQNCGRINKNYVGTCGCGKRKE